MNYPACPFLLVSLFNTMTDACIIKDFDWNYNFLFLLKKVDEVFMIAKQNFVIMYYLWYHLQNQLL